MKKEVIDKWFKLVPKEILEKTFVVGGCVRDLILNPNEEPNDIDFVIENSSHEEMISLGFIKVGADFEVYLKNGCEFALCRTEKSKGKEKNYLNFETNTKNVSIEEDLMRRDLKINAMAINHKGVLIDPYNGLEDLKNKKLTHVSKAFSDDPVRVLRLARFTAKFTDFEINEETKDLVLTLRKDLRNLTKERVFKELEKALNSKKPSNFFRSLKELKVLDIIFPEIFEMDFLPHNKKYHYEGNVFEHSLLVLDKATELSDLSEVRFGALYHDIGKIKTYKGQGKFHGHSDKDIVFEELSLLKNRLRLSNKYFNLAYQGAIFHHKFYDLLIMNEKTIVKMLFSKDFPKTEKDLDNLIIIVRSDSLGRLKFENNKIINGEDFEYINLIKDLFKVKKEKIDVSHLKNVEQIQQFLHKKRISLVKSILKKYKSAK